MRLEHYSEQKLKTQILEAVGKYLALRTYRVFLFGSRINGLGSDRSDIDIGIDGPESIPGEIKVEIEEALDSLPVLYKFDLVDFKSVTENFRQQALKSVEHLN